MAIKIIQDKKTLTSTTLRPGQSASIEFTPQEGEIEVMARAVQTGDLPKPPGNPNPSNQTPIHIKQNAEVMVALFPPDATVAEKTKTFEFKVVVGNEGHRPLELGVRPEHAGKLWKCTFNNSGTTEAKVSGTVHFVKERIIEEPAPSDVSINVQANLPLTFMRPSDAKLLLFKPTEGVIEISVVAAETNLAKPPGKPDPNNQTPLLIQQNVNVDVELSAPDSADVVSHGHFRSTQLLDLTNHKPVIRHSVPAALAGREWTCRFINVGTKNIFCTGKASFVGKALRSQIPLRVLNNGLRQLIAAIGLTIRLNGKVASFGTSEELRAFATEQLGETLAVPIPSMGPISADFSDFNLSVLSVRARTDTGQPLITGHAFFEVSGEEIDNLRFVGLDIADLNITELALQLDVELRVADSPNGRRVLNSIMTVTVNAGAFAQLFNVIGIDVSDFVRDTIESKLKELVDAATFKAAVRDYLTEGLVQLVQRGHEFHDLLVEPEAFVLIHVDRGGDDQPAQPPHIEFPRSRLDGPAPVDEVALANLNKIDRIVVLMQENRSFDHILGYLSHPDHGLPRLQADPQRDIPDGLRGDESNPPAGSGVPVDFAPYPADVVIHGTPPIPATATPFSPHHEHEHVVNQIAAGKMAGFVKDFSSRFRVVDPQFAMSFFTDEHVPVFDALAAKYAICDRWFCSHPGGTQPNRFCTLSGHTPVLENFAVGDPILGYLRMRTVFDALTESGVDWVYYEGDIGFLRTYDRYRLDNKHVIPFNDPNDGFIRKAELGLLPPVTFIDPNFADIPPAAAANDDHPPSDLRRGQLLIAKVHDALTASPQWVSQGGTAGALLIITYDEHGGFYDHVPPPGTPESNLPNAVSLIHPEGESFYGVRVPTFVVSPFARAGAVNSTVFDHTSIIATILRRFVGEVPVEFGPRTATANHLGGLLELDVPRQPGRPLGVRVPQETTRRFRETFEDPSDFRAAMRAIAQPSKPS